MAHFNFVHSEGVTTIEALAVIRGTRDIVIFLDTPDGDKWLSAFASIPASARCALIDQVQELIESDPYANVGATGIMQVPGSDQLPPFPLGAIIGLDARVSAGAPEWTGQQA